MARVQQRSHRKEEVRMGVVAEGSAIVHVNN